ncbi:MAG: hypothetical protein ACYDH1_00740 [Anaerolineaceae bacterium]
MLLIDEMLQVWVREFVDNGDKHAKRITSTINVEPVYEITHSQHETILWHVQNELQLLPFQQSVQRTVIEGSGLQYQ